MWQLGGLTPGSQVNLPVNRRTGSWAMSAPMVVGRQLVDEGDPGVSGDEVFLRDNSGDLDLWGFELSGRVGLFAPDSGRRLEGIASWVRGQQYDDTRNPTTGDEPLDGVDPRIDPDGTDAWTTLNLEFRGQLRSGVDWTLAFRNMLNESYRVHGSGLDGPGHSAAMGLRLSF